MGSIKKLASEYLNKNDVKYSKSEIETAMKSIRDAISDHHNEKNSLFSVEDMDEQTFMDMMRDITNSSDGSLDNEISILFSVINSDGDEKISADEFSVAFDTKTSDKSISNYELWHNLWGVEELKDETTKTADVNDGAEKTEEPEKAEEPKNTEEPEKAEEPEQAEGAENTEEPAQAEGKQTVKKDVEKPEDFSDRKSWQDIVDYINNGILENNEDLDTPQEVVTYLYKKGVLTEDESRYAMYAFIYLSLDDEQKSTADYYLDKGVSFEEVTQSILKIDIKQTPYYKKPSEVNGSKVEEAEASEQQEEADELSDKDDVGGLTVNQANEHAEQLHEAFETHNMNIVNYILSEEDISDEAFAYIIKTYEEKYGSILNTFSNNSSDEWDLDTQMWSNNLANRLMNAAKNGDENALKVLTNDTHTAIGGSVSIKTKQAFLDVVFNSDDNLEMIAKVDKLYSESFGSDMSTDMRGCYHWYLDGVVKVGDGEKYSNRIKKARLNYSY